MGACGSGQRKGKVGKGQVRGEILMVFCQGAVRRGDKKTETSVLRAAEKAGRWFDCSTGTSFCIALNKQVPIASWWGAIFGAFCILLLDLMMIIPRKKKRGGPEPKNLSYRGKGVRCDKLYKSSMLNIIC